MVNAVYGKTIENLLKRFHVKICRSKEELLQAVSKKTYKRQIIVNEELVIVTQEKPIVLINKPYYIGFSILDISKYIMYDYFYNILGPYFGNYKDVQLLYSDTDSLILKIKSNDLISDLKYLSPHLTFPIYQWIILYSMIQKSLNYFISKKNLAYSRFYV